MSLHTISGHFFWLIQLTVPHFLPLTCTEEMISSCLLSLLIPQPQVKLGLSLSNDSLTHWL